MIELLSAIGWGLLACGAVTHIWHHGRLRQLLAMHLDHERVPAVALTTIEAALALAIPLAVLADLDWLRWLAVAALVLALGFAGWIARLLATGSDLPCACSFSEAPTSRWSLARALCVALVGAYVFVDPATGDADTALQIATLVVGWAVAAAIFVLPEAISWPPASRALLLRVEAHAAAGNES